MCCVVRVCGVCLRVYVLLFSSAEGILEWCMRLVDSHMHTHTIFPLVAACWRFVHWLPWLPDFGFCLRVIISQFFSESMINSSQRA